MVLQYLDRRFQSHHTLIAIDDCIVSSQPPKDLLIEVRVLKDCGGKVMTDSGPISLDKGSIHFLKRYVSSITARQHGYPLFCMHSHYNSVGTSQIGRGTVCSRRISGACSPGRPMLRGTASFDFVTRSNKNQKQKTCNLWDLALLVFIIYFTNYTEIQPQTTTTNMQCLRKLHLICAHKLNIFEIKSKHITAIPLFISGICGAGSKKRRRWCPEQQ